MILRNGTEESDSLVQATMLKLSHLWGTHPVAAFELVEIARDPTHSPFGETGNDLRSLGLLSADGHMHQSVRNVVLSAVCGEGFNMELVNPEIEEGK